MYVYEIKLCNYCSILQVIAQCVFQAENRVGEARFDVQRIDVYRSVYSPDGSHGIPAIPYRCVAAHCRPLPDPILDYKPTQANRPVLPP